MARPVPKGEGYWYRNNYAQKQPAKKTAWNPEKVLFLTMWIFILSLMLQFALDKMLADTVYLKNKIFNESRFMLQKQVYLQKELEEMLSPTAIQEKALEQNMKKADIIYYLRLGKL